MKAPNTGLYLLIAVLGAAGGLLLSLTAKTATAPAPTTPGPAGLQQVLGQTKSTQTGAVPAPQAVLATDKPLPLQNVSAASFLVYDINAKTVLLERNSHQQRAVASLTKLMTALVAYRSLSLDEMIMVDDQAVSAERPTLGLPAGETVAARDLFNAMLVGSANDAALILARRIEASEGAAFPVLMNNTARQLGMFESNFSNPLGFDSVNNFSSAHDIALLVQTTSSYEQFRRLGRLHEYSFSGHSGRTYRVAATNTLIAADSEISAVKTGYTDNALGTMVTRAQSGGHEIVIIVLGSLNREQDTVLLKRLVFENFVWR